MATRDIYETAFDKDVQTSQHSCPECDGRVTTNTHETVCDDCGLILSDQAIDPGPEWRSFPEDQSNPERTGAPLTPSFHDQGLSTSIGKHQDGKGRSLSPEKQRQLRRLRREQGRAQRATTRERNQVRGFYEIRRIVSGLDLGRSIRDQTCALFRTTQDNDLLRGRSLEAIAAGCVYAVCRCNSLPRSIAEIARFAQCDEASVRNAFGVLNTELGLPTPPPTPQLFIPQLASSLNLSPTVRHRALDYIEQARKQGIGNGCNPAGVAAACLELASRDAEERVLQVNLAAAADVSTCTLRKHRDTLAEAV
ncbi:transcription initiation factor IIB family protein [Haladaptatus sp. GCM10025707]|uniref:transcription initiation factor IIB n=1 Tax=unclassified Haladaptatus TaxID=2622732 RepID=UPI0023E7F7B1|nr:transcription initiation factor IIB family protein [Haladaptatus sp. QDMS2]